MSKKQLDTTGVLSELTGQSAFFRKETTAPSSPTPQKSSEPERTEIRTDKRSEMRSASFPTKRLTRRYSFEFYDDQITQIKSIKHDLEMAGERVSLSDIVREALDQYLNRNHVEDRTEIRSEERTNETPNG